MDDRLTTATGWPATAQVLSWAVLAEDLDFAAALHERLRVDPARGLLPFAEAFIAWHEGVYLSAVGNAAPPSTVSTTSAACAPNLAGRCWKRLAGADQVPLLIQLGDLPTARQRMIEALAGSIRTGDHLTVWMSCHHFVRLLAELGDHDHAREIWAELRDRGGWTDPSQRADLEARLGPPGQPRLTDDELIARVSTLITELE